jgi:serine/threonine-protein kinase
LNDRYEVGDVIGRGGMGEVRRAFDRRLARDVAVKFLRPDLASQPIVRQRFEDEARNAARLTNPHVVLVLDTGEEQGRPYLVMECLPGQSLHDEFAAGPMSPERVRSVAREILSALGAAHEMGVLHRDVTPSNILLTEDGRAKIADFGIAKTTDGLDQTVVGQVLGTPAYLAPERLRGEPATPAADIYALGVVLYEALTGQKAYSGDTPISVAHAVMSTDATPLRELQPDLDPGLMAAVDGAMEKDPARRIPDAATMLSLIEREAPVTTSEFIVPAVAATTMLETTPAAETVVEQGYAFASAAPADVVGPRPPLNRTLGLTGNAWIAIGLVLAAVVLVLSLAMRDGDTPTAVTQTSGAPVVTTALTAPPTTIAARTVRAVDPTPARGKGDDKKGHGKDD